MGSSSSQAQGGSSSSFSAVLGQIIFNKQNCLYAEGVPYGTLVCSEKTYKTVTITSASSSITIMAENLNLGRTISGTAVDGNQADDDVIEKYCYGDIEANCIADGGLYQWAEAMGFSSTCNITTCATQISTGNHQGICPTGWHIPKAAEWNALASMLGGKTVAGKTMKLNTTGYAYWDADSFNDGNSSGFSALPAGYRANGGGWSNDRGYNTLFWDATEGNSVYGGFRSLSDSYWDFFEGFGYKALGVSLRCIKD